MIETSKDYKTAITATQRRILVKAVVDIVDPDLAYGTVKSSGEAPWSKPGQLHDKVMELDSRYSTLEPGHWPLDGSCRLIPDDPQQLTGEVGDVGKVLCDKNGVFSPAVFVEQPMSNLSILQACSVYFSQDPLDGFAVDFTVSILSAGQEVYSKQFAGNREISVSLTDFTVYDPDAIRVTVTKWSLPGRRLRIVEIIPGVYEEWRGDKISSIDIRMLGNFACLAIPYSTCTFTLNNRDRRFEPYRKSSLFESIQDRQKIDVSLGVKLENGIVEWVPVGTYYQASGGWKTGNNDLTLTWQLTDIVGLLADRDFIPPTSLPTTLGGWIAALAAQLGDNFKNRWYVDPAYINKAVTISIPDHLKNLTCGAVARFVAMATGTWIRADQETGSLTAEPFWQQGNQVKPAAMSAYPTKRANDELAALIFKLYDGSGTTYVVSGNSTSSSRTLAINNPFIHTKQQAITAAKQILSQYGGIIMETTSRGDMSSEIGDVDTVWISRGEAKTGRRMEQNFAIHEGVLKDCRSVLLQADGSFLFENRQVFTSDGVFHTGPHTTKVRLIVVQGGQGSSRGEDGSVGGSGNLPGQGVTSAEGQKGVPGDGGMVWSGIVGVNPDTDYQIKIGKGGAPSLVYGKPGEEGTHTTFGVHTSAAGKQYSPSFTDISSGNAYGRTGVEKPVNGTGDGAEGGDGGEAGVGYWEQLFWPDGRPRGWEFIVTKQPGPGKPGKRGADGVCVVYWDKEGEE